MSLGDEIEAAGIAPPPRPGTEPALPETVPDFTRREYALREQMDDPCTYAVYRRAAIDLARINRVTRGHRPTLEFLTRVLAGRNVGYEPLHIVDVGCAQGESLRTIYHWAAKRSLPLKLTGVDINPYAARLARECDRAEHVSAGAIDWITADAFQVKLDRPPDVVTCSLFAHHLSDEQIVHYLRWCNDQARAGWFIGDLRRSERAARWFSRLAWAIGACEMVKYDGVISFRRALSLEDWRQRCSEAGVQATIRDVGIGRLCVEHLLS